jgi:hypothetical protein
MGCPYRRRICHPIEESADLWADRAAWLHRHDHRRCIRAGTAWIHPDDPEDLHAEPELYVCARSPLQARYAHPWQVAAVSVLIPRTSTAQSTAAAEALLGPGQEGGGLVEEIGQLAWRDRIAPVVRPLGLIERRLDLLAVLGSGWPEYQPSAEMVAGLVGRTGRYVVEAYRVLVLGQADLVPTDRVLRLHLEMRSMGRAGGRREGSLGPDHGAGSP